MALPQPASTTSSTSNPNPTAPIPAVTTPYPQPPSCSSVLTTTVSVSTAFGTSSSRTLILPDTSDPRYTACFAPAGAQPSFSPAVCPQGWPAWWIGQTPAPSSVGSSAAPSITTAYCCAPGYSILQPGGQDPSCSQAFVGTTSSSGGSLVSTTTLSVAMLPAWHISWRTTDVPTLSPQPPALEGNDRITRWVPGSNPEWERRDGWGGGISTSLFWFLVVGIPLLVVALITACCLYCWRVRRRRRSFRK